MQNTRYGSLTPLQGYSQCILRPQTTWLVVLYIDFRPGQTCHSKVMHRKEVTHSDGSDERKSRRWAWLKKWDKVKSHGTLIDWYTGREWPLNCMTVISAWWRSKMPFQRLSGRVNYYITRLYIYMCVCVCVCVCVRISLSLSLFLSFSLSLSLSRCIYIYIYMVILMLIICK